MEHFDIAVATRSFQQRLKEALQTAQRIGTEGVQFDARHEIRPREFSATGRRELLHRLDVLGLRVASLSFPVQKSLYDQEQLPARIDGLKEALQLAFQLKAQLVTGRIGRIPDQPESPEYAVLVEVLNDIARHSNRVGATFCITPSRDSAESLLRLCNAVREGPIGVNFDPAGLIMSGQDPIPALRTLREYVTHIHVRDAVRDVDGTGIEVPVGRGEVEWDEFLALVDEIGYRGWLTIERTQGEDRIDDCARAVQYLRRVAAG